MIATVIASGSSAKDWTPRGVTIGVNDCRKWGKEVNILILVNRPQKFSPERLAIISQHKGEVLTNSVKAWKEIFPHAKKLERMVSFSSRVNAKTHYTSATSPIIAISHGIALGAKTIIIYGIDLISHHAYNVNTKAGQREADVYRKFFKACNKIGVNIYLGAKGSVFDKDLLLWAGVMNEQPEMIL